MCKNYILCGVGGQGVVLASKLIAYGAMKKGEFVRTTETIGMAQRGGSVTSHVRVGEKAESPMVPLGTADVVFGFEPGEAVRALPYLKDGGMMIVNTKAVKPVTAALGGTPYCGEDMLRYLKEKVKTLILVDGEKICEKCGSPKVLNIALLGAGVSQGALDMSMAEMEAAVRENTKEAFIKMNLYALALGAEGK